jgi:hypothetical protein
MRRMVRQMNDLTVVAVLVAFYFIAFAIPAAAARLARLTRRKTAGTYWETPGPLPDWRSDY